MRQHLVITAIAAAALTFSAASFAADPAAGKAAWNAEHAQTDGSPARSCATCHGQDLTQAGRHAKTGKVIEPMAPSVNLQRLTDPEKIEKWLARNCKWTFERECSTNEKADFISYIKTQ
jgi:mono/diheme cytochrome c family protein